MKISLDRAGASPFQPSFSMLCAALRAAQAATPTARSTRRLHATVARTARDAPLFGGAGLDIPAWRRGSFHRSALDGVRSW